MTRRTRDPINVVTIEQLGTPGGPSLVFLGGWAMNTHTYRDRLTDLTAHGTVYAISLPGFGGNPSLPIHQSTIAHHATVIHDALRQQNIPAPYTLIGHSTGAGIATQIAAHHPDQVRAIILITPVGHPDPISQSLLRMAIASAREVIRSFRHQPLPTLDLKADRNLPSNLRLAVDAKNTNLTQPLTTLAETGTPVHLILATDDAITPPGDLLHIPHAHIYPVTGGHTWFATKPEEFTELFANILTPPAHNITTPWYARIPIIGRWLTRWATHR